jgi:hypothetical protein
VTPWKAARDDTLAIVVTVAGRDLRSETLGPCAMRFYGRGVLVRATACRDHAPIRFRLVTVNDHTSRARLWIKRTPQRIKRAD